MTSVKNLMKYSSTVMAEKDKVIFMQGAPGDDMYVVAKGKCGVYVNSFSDFPLRIAEIGMGNFFGEMSALDGAPRSATIIAEEDSILLKFQKENFLNLIKESPDMGMTMLVTLCKRIRGLNDEMAWMKAMSEEIILSESGSDGQYDEKEHIPIMEDNITFGVVVPEKYDYYVDEREILCPVCKAEFTEKIPVFSTMKVISTDRDLRKRYENFDVNWFNICVCPHCNYANSYIAFHQISDYYIDDLKASGYRERVEKFSGFPPKRTIDDVIKAHYLSLICNEMSTKKAIDAGKLWIKLYWIYDDLGDTRKKLESAQKALESYEKGLHQENLKYYTANEKMQLYTTIAELAIATVDFEKAVKYYQKNLAFDKSVNETLLIQSAQALKELKRKV